jgi:hypothetical protein
MKRLNKNLGIHDDNYTTPSDDEEAEIPCFKDSGLKPSPLLNNFFLSKFKISPENLDLAFRVLAKICVEQELYEDSWEVGDDGLERFDPSFMSITDSGDKAKPVSSLMIKALQFVEEYGKPMFTIVPTSAELLGHFAECHRCIQGSYGEVAGRFPADGDFDLEYGPFPPNLDVNLYYQLKGATLLSNALVDYTALPNLNSLESEQTIMTLAAVHKYLAHMARELKAEISINF